MCILTNLLLSSSPPPTNTNIHIHNIPPHLQTHNFIMISLWITTFYEYFTTHTKSKSLMTWSRLKVFKKQHIMHQSEETQINEKQKESLISVIPVTELFLRLWDSQQPTVGATIPKWREYGTLLNLAVLSKSLQGDKASSWKLQGNPEEHLNLCWPHLPLLGSKFTV